MSEIDYQLLAKAIVTEMGTAATTKLEQQYLSVATVAVQLDCTYKHVRDLVELGELSAINIAIDLGKRQAWRISASSVAQMLKKRVVKASGPSLGSRI